MCKCIGGVVTIVSVLVSIPLLIIYLINSKDPVLSVESTAVKAYNLTADDSLFCIINLGVRARNPNKRLTNHHFKHVDMELRKGKHHKLADDALTEFKLGPTDETVVPVEAVGLRVDVKRKIAQELAADVAAGEGKVNVFMSGKVGSKILKVKCKGVVIHFSRSTVVDQKVKCKVRLIDKSERRGKSRGRKSRGRKSRRPF